MTQDVIEKGETLHNYFQEKKNLTRLFTQVVSASLLHMHGNDKGHIRTYLEMIEKLTEKEFVSDDHRISLGNLIVQLEKLIAQLNKKSQLNEKSQEKVTIKLQGAHPNNPGKIREITKQEYKNGRRIATTDETLHRIQFGAVITNNTIALDNTALTPDVVDGEAMSQTSSLSSIGSQVTID